MPLLWRKPQIIRFSQLLWLPEQETKLLPAQISAASRPLLSLSIYLIFSTIAEKSLTNNQNQAVYGPDFVERPPAAAVSTDCAQRRHRRICRQKYPVAGNHNHFLLHTAQAIRWRPALCGLILPQTVYCRQVFVSSKRKTASRFHRKPPVT